MLHYYGMMERGCSIGAQPKGFEEFWDVDRKSTGFYSILAYSRCLSIEEMQSYMLQYLGTERPTQLK